MDKSEERRRFFRIDDLVELDYQIISGLESRDPNAPIDPSVRYFQVINALYEIESDNIMLSRRLEQEYPIIARYFKVMNSKIDMLAHSLLSPTTSKQLEWVNLSAGGIAFRAEQSIPEGAQLKIRVILHPSLEGIFNLATVVKCAHMPQPEFPNKPYRISASFNNLSETSEQILMRHVLQKQAEGIRALRFQQAQGNSSKDE